MIDACRSPLPKVEAEEEPVNKKKDLTKDTKTKAANSKTVKANQTVKSKNPVKQIITKKTTEGISPQKKFKDSFIVNKNYEEIIPQIVNDAKGVVILIGTSPNEASLEDEDLKSGKFTYYMRKAISGGIQDETAAEYITLESLEFFIKKKFDQEAAEYLQLAKENGLDEPTQTKPKQAVYKVSTQRGFTGDFLITYGRPPETKVQLERRAYLDLSEERTVAAKVLFNKNKERYDLKFFAKSKDTGKYYPESLEGVSRLKYMFDRNSSGDLNGFEGEQFNFKEEPVFSHGLELDEENGWEYNSIYSLTQEDKKDIDRKRIRFQKQKFDFNGNNISQEYFDEKGNIVKDGNVAKIIRAWDTNGEKVKEEFFDSNGNPSSNKSGYYRYAALYLEKGKLISEEYFNLGDSLAENEEGISKKIFAYDGEYKLKSIETFDRAEKLTGGKDDVAITNYNYNNVCVQRVISNRLAETPEFSLLTEEKARLEFIEKTKRKETYRDCIENEVYFDKLKMPKAKPNGIARIENQFNEKGLKTLEQYFRQDNRPLQKGGIFRTTYAYDEKNRVVSKKFFGEARNTKLEPVPASDERGIHEYRYQYGTTGGGKFRFGYKKELLERVTYHGVDGKLVSISDDTSIEEHLYTFNRETKEYEKAVIHFLNVREDFIRADKTNLTLRLVNENQDEILEEYLDKHGKLKEDAGGQAQYLRHFKSLEKGLQVIVEPYRADGKTQGNNFGVMKAVFEYDERGNQTLKERYDANEKLKGGDNFGIAKIISKFDEHSNRILNETYGEDGKLRAGDKYGIARYVSKYDTNGNHILGETYDAEEKLIGFDEYGVARYVYQYDSNGNNTLEEFYGADEKLIGGDNFDVARVVSKYDESGNQILRETYDAEEKLKAGYETGTARTIMKYDAKGNIIQEEIYGEDGKLLPNYIDVRTFWKYDEKGNIILRERYSATGELGMRTVYTYDTNGKLSSEKSTDAKGKLKESEANVAEIIYQYDANGNKIREESYGANGELRNEKESGIAQSIWTYDVNGNRISEETYDEDGKLKPRNKIVVEEDGNETYIPDPEEIAQSYFIYDNAAKEKVIEQYNSQWKLIQSKLILAVKEKNFKEISPNIEKQISFWNDRIDRKSYNLERKLYSVLGRANGLKLFQEFTDFQKKITTELENCTLRKVTYKADGTLIERVERFNRYRPLTTEKPDENGVLASPEYHLYFPNPRGQFDKRLIHMKLDRFYRPIGLEFEKR